MNPMLAGIRARAPALIFQLPRLFYGALSIALAAAVFGQIAVKFSFNVNEGWNAYWADAAQKGLDLYPGPSSFKLNNYPPLWFYATGALGRIVHDNIQAGRILSGIALFLTAVIVGLIVREIAGPGRHCGFAGAALLAIFALFYQEYAGTDDGQTTANLFAAAAILLFLRRINGRLGFYLVGVIIPLMLVGGLIKNNILAAPLSIAIFLAINNRSAFALYAVCATVWVAIICGLLLLIFGRDLFSSVLLPRPYDWAVAWDQAIDQIRQYNLFLLAIPFLALRAGRKENFIFIYSIVSFIQGALLSGGRGVDVNVFFDFAIATSIGIGLVAGRLAKKIGVAGAGRQTRYLLPVWLVFALMPPALSLNSGVSFLYDIFGTVMANTQAADVEYISSTPGRAMCDAPALCYWAGKKFTVDLNSLPTLIWVDPPLLGDFLQKIKTCSFALIQLSPDWADDRESVSTFPEFTAALSAHYAQARTTETALYYKPINCNN
jgi:hypothetical protein